MMSTPCLKSCRSKNSTMCTTQKYTIGKTDFDEFVPLGVLVYNYHKKCMITLHELKFTQLFIY